MKFIKFRSSPIAFLTLIFFSAHTLLFAAPISRKISVPPPLPPELGTIQEQFQGDPGSPLVIHVQESHSDPEAQEKIAEILQFFQAKLHTRLLAVEGASGEIPVDELRKFPNLEVKEKASKFLLDQLILDGASYAAIRSAQPFRYVGVEDESLYESNVRHYRKVKNQSRRIEAFLQHQEKVLRQEEERIASRPLKDFYKRHREFSQGRLSLANYTGQLLAEKEKAGLSIDDLRQVQILERLFQIEALRNPGKLEEEKVSEGPRDEDFLLDHPQIRSAMEERGLKAMLAASILMEEIKVLSNRVKQQVLISPAEKALDQKWNEFERLERVLRLQAVRSDLESRFRESGFEPAFEFYRVAKQRDAAMVNNFLKYVEISGLRTQDSRPSTAFLVTGGFHTEGITRILRERRISYWVIAPRLGELHPKDFLYERRLAGNFQLELLAARRAPAQPSVSERILELWRRLDGAGDLSDLAIARAYQEGGEGRSLGELDAHSKILRILKKVYSGKDQVPGRETPYGIFMPSDLVHIVTVMTRLGIGPGKKVLDIGSGDGRIVYAAALLGAQATGIEGDPDLFAQSVKHQKIFGVSRLAKFLNADFLEHPLGDYDFIFYFIAGSKKEDRIERKILREMKPGARLVLLTGNLFSGPYFTDLETVPSDSTIQAKDSFYQLYQIPVTILGREGADITLEDWMNAWTEKLRSGVLSFVSGKWLSKSRGPFEIRFIPSRDLSKRRVIRNFRDAPEQNLFRARSYGRRYLFGVNRFPAGLGHGLIYDDLGLEDSVPGQVLDSARLKELLGFQIRYPFMKFYFNGGPKAGASVPAFHAQLIVDQALPIETWERETAAREGDVTFSRLKHHPGTGFVFSGGTLGERSRAVGKFLAAAKEREIPYNVIVAKDGEIYLFLRDPRTERKDLGGWEHSGIFIAQNQEAYDRWDSDEFLRRELASAALREKDFQAAFGSLLQASSLGTSTNGETAQKWKRVFLWIGGVSVLLGAANYVSMLISPTGTSLKDLYIAAHVSLFSGLVASGLVSGVTNVLAGYSALYLSDNPSQKYQPLPRFFYIFVFYTLFYGPSYFLLSEWLAQSSAVPYFAKTSMAVTFGIVFGSVVSMTIPGHFAWKWADVLESRRLEAEAALIRKEYDWREQAKKTIQSIFGRLPFVIVMHDLTQNYFSLGVKVLFVMVAGFFVEIYKYYITNLKVPKPRPLIVLAIGAWAASLSFLIGSYGSGLASLTAALFIFAMRHFADRFESAVTFSTPPSGVTRAVTEEVPVIVHSGSRSERPAAQGESLGFFSKVSLNRVSRLKAWFNRSERVGDEVVFLMRRQTLEELSRAEKLELEFHIKHPKRKLILLHEKEDKNLDVAGLAGRVSHWWGSAGDYLQVLRRHRHPHVIYLASENEIPRFSVPGVMNVKHSLYAPTAAVEVLFQGGIDLYGIWEKKNGRWELTLSDRLQALFGEVLPQKWLATAA